MDLSMGGHLTHGSAVNFSGIQYNVVSYGVQQETGLIDYDQMREVALRENQNAYRRFLSVFKRFRLC